MSKKITEMDKAEILAYLKASHEIRHFDDGLHSWKRAIDLYKQATGMPFDSDCSGCRKRLFEWLNQP